MTREEILESILESSKKYIDSLEVRIAELETPMSCDGCNYEEFYSDADKLMICIKCTRLWDDNYEPKDSK